MGEWSSIIKTISTALGALAGYMFGGWNMLMNLLLWLVVLDWLTGWAAAWIKGELKSRKGYHGIARKVAIFGLVVISHFIDVILGGQQYFQNAVVFFYLANELLSIIENVGRMGVPVPKVFRRAIEEFNEISGEKGDGNEVDRSSGEAPDPQDKAV
ncbi:MULTISPECIES: phage holin family protein [Paenibacillus]|jgi:toxin secretion/phage lysis holin|uniref:phage holin family protein n=1 Tax=Paenibacillus TaxID=44249 RepID=UPI00240CF64C|nr:MULTISPECIES: phage holin family protein [Paenibacillus]MCI1776589.1 phage holin family protein [Paenibacillus lautus]WFB57582.1 phage holin family protein [Paenibacillus sp. BR1-192]